MSTVPLISLILPTRGRVDKARHFIASARDHADHPRCFEVILGVDDDDITSHDIDVPGVRLAIVKGPRRTMGMLNTECAGHAEGDILMLVNDDILIRTKGWDTQLRALHDKFEDQVYLGYVNDLFKGKKLCTFPILSRATYLALQCAFPSEYKGAFIDYHLLDVFMRLKVDGIDRVIYLEEVIFEHLHYRLGKSVKDSTYIARDRFGDDQTFFELSALRNRQARVLKNMIHQQKTEKAFDQKVKQCNWPTTLFKALKSFSSEFLSNQALPITWRMFLFRWFLARWLYARYLIGVTQ